MGGKTWKRILCILIIVLYVIFMVGTAYINIKYYDKRYRVHFMCELIGAAFILAGSCLYYTWSKKALKRKWLITPFIFTALALTIFSYIMYFVYLPEYTVKEAYTIIKEAPLYISTDVIHDEMAFCHSDNNNPFVYFNYTFNIGTEDNPVERMYFDPVTGEYVVTKVR